MDVFLSLYCRHTTFDNLNIKVVSGKGIRDLIVQVYGRVVERHLYIINKV